MIVGIDTDVLVHWAMDGARHHRVVRRFFEAEVRERSSQLGLTSQVIFEFLHVCTDARRFEHPLSMEAALHVVRELWDGPEVVRILPAPIVVHRTVELLEQLRLGRKRILDTALAATLEAAGVACLATFNREDFQVFPFLEVITPV
ncbi:PIN domain-containing protein [Acidobacteria bacterium AH-259-L09]|nr:PIN domain-containing protein [Acidobacteria bacterium AH-259-L09]